MKKKNSELYHHGILGQKWGVRRFQNADGSLTEAGKKRADKRMKSDKEHTIQKGSTFYRMSVNEKSDANGEKIYVNAGKEGSDFYNTNLANARILQHGKVFVQEYTAKNDIKMPSKRTMEKIELSLLNDPKVRGELIDSLMKKGYTREYAEQYAKKYSKGKEYIERISNTAALGLVGAAYGAALGAQTGDLKGVGMTAAIAGAMGAGLGVSIGSTYRQDQLSKVRMSYGDKNNKVMNEALRKKLADKGYNAMKDYNDRRAYGEDGKQALIVFDSDKNISLKSSKKMTSDIYGESYARNYKKKNPKSESSFESLVDEGKKKYDKLYEDGLIYRQQKKDAQAKRKKMLKKAKANEK